MIALSIPQLECTVELHPAADWDFAVTELLRATVTLMKAQHPDLVAIPGRFAFTTTIPRQVGLSGSSAIIMAALRALAERADRCWDPVELAKATLEVETDVLGWTAGPQDRVVQAYEGLVDMDFAEPWQPAGYERLDPARLPSLFVAWQHRTGEASDVVHSDVRDRWLSGDPEVRRTMIRFAELAAEGRTALDEDQAARVWPRLFNEAFELRRRIWRITESDASLVDTGRTTGAGVTFAGSGGAVVGAMSDPARLDDAAAAYAAAGAGYMVIRR